MSWAETKAAARQSVHEAFKRAALYLAPGSIDDPVECFVRWHAAGARLGHLNGSSDGYAEVVTTRDRIVFDTTTIEFVPSAGGTITLVATEYEPARSFLLDVQEEPDGPVTDAWMVSRA